MLIAAIDIPWGVFLALVALCAVAVAVVELRRWQFRRVSLREVTRAEQAALREQREIHQQTAALLAELQAAAESVSRLIDEKIERLHAELRAAERAATRTAAPPAGAEYSKSRGGTNDGSPEPSVSALEPPAKSSPATSGPVAPAADSIVLRAAARPLEELAPPRDPRIDRVLELAAAGRRSMQIAEALSMPLGEVELILNLRRLERDG